MKMETALIKPDILSVHVKEGGELRQRGKYYFDLCFNHSERTPSLCIDPHKQTFHCYGCGIYGDVIDLIKIKHNLSFKDACKYLGIATGKPPKPNIREIRKKEVIKRFKAWCDSYYDLLCIFYREWQDVKATIKSLEDAEKYAEFYNEELKAQHHMDILCGADNEAKYELFREVTSHAN